MLLPYKLLNQQNQKEPSSPRLRAGELMMVGWKGLLYPPSGWTSRIQLLSWDGAGFHLKCSVRGQSTHKTWYF